MNLRIPPRPSANSAVKFSRHDDNEEQQYYLQDANFNVTAVVNASGTVLERYHYTPYGEVTFLDLSFGFRGSSTIGNTHLYTGRERDPETGLQLNRNRYYAAHMGRWVNRDPIGYEGSEWNLHEYVGSNPIIIVDPEGTFYPWKWWKCKREMWKWFDDCKKNIPDCDQVLIDSCSDINAHIDCEQRRRKAIKDCSAKSKKMFEACIKAVYSVPPGGK